MFLKKIKFNPVLSALSFSKKMLLGLHIQLRKKQKIFITVLNGKFLMYVLMSTSIVKILEKYL